MAKTPDTNASPAPVSDDAAPATKGHATPTRKEREAARKQPLVPSDRRLAARQSRTQLNSARDRARVGMAAGEEKFLPLRDKGPQKRYARDYIDARTSVGEILLPAMVIVFATLLLPGQLQIWGTFVAYALILVVAVDAIVLGFQLKKKLADKFGADKVQPIRWYAFMRVIQMRPLRLPKPQVKRGQFPS